MTLKIDNAIEEIERVLAGNKPKYANDIYLNNAIRYLQEIKSPSLTDDQQVVLEWWIKKLNEEGEGADPLGVICAMQSYGLREEKIYDAAVNLTPAEQFQVLAAFASWGSKEGNQ